MSKQMRNRIRMVLRWVFYVGNEYFTTARRRIETRRDDKKKLQHLELRNANSMGADQVQVNCS